MSSESTALGISRSSARSSSWPASRSNFATAPDPVQWSCSRKTQVVALLRGQLAAVAQDDLDATRHLLWIAKVQLLALAYPDSLHEVLHVAAAHPLVRELGDRLALAVLVDLERGAREPLDEPAVPVADGRGHDRQLSLRERRRRGQQRQQDKERTFHG